jgi:hypothetical protein
MIPEYSHVIRNLTDIEISTLTEELQSNSHWVEHPVYPLHKKAFYGGKSLILNWITEVDGQYQLQWTTKELFPNTWKLLEELAGGKPIAKVYWHKIPPGAMALPHSDVRNPYIARDDIFKRYNYYLDIDPAIEFKFDDTEDIWDNSTFENTLFDVSTIKMHSVVNKSQSTLYALIVDVLNPGVPINYDLFTVQISQTITDIVTENYPDYVQSMIPHWQVK